MPWDEQKFVMVSLTPGWWSNCAAHDQSYEAMTSDEMEIDAGKSEGPAWGICARGICARTKSALLQWVLSVHDERVLAIISLPGILLLGTGVRCQPYLQRSNFTAKEQFRVSKRASSTCQAFLVSLAVCEQNVSTTQWLLSRVKEENRSTETIGSAWVMTVWRQISSSSEGMLGVKWNSLGHAALLRWSYSQDHSTVAHFPRAQWITIHWRTVYRIMPPCLSEMSSVTCNTLFPTKVLNWHGLPTSQLNTIVWSVQGNI